MLRTIIAASLLPAALGACASVGNVMPGGYTQTGTAGPLIQTADAGDYTAQSEEGRGLATVENRGEFNVYVLDLPEVEAELDAMLAPVAAQWPHETPRPARVKVAMNTSYQAVTFADGVIAVNIGALDDVPTEITAEQANRPYARSDQELMYLLSHEYAHYALAHHNKTDAMANVRNLAQNLVRAHNTYAMLTEVRYNENSGFNVNEGAVRQDIDKAVAKYDLMQTMLTTALGPSWNRRQEDEADVLGLDLMMRAGVQGPFYADVFEKLKHQETLNEALATELQSAFETSTEQLMSEQSLQAALSGNGEAVGMQFMSDLQTSILAGVSSAVGRVFSQTHRDPEVRLDGVRTYEANAYPDLDVFAISAETTDLLERIRANEEFGEAKIATIAYYNAQEKRADGAMGEAEAEIQKAMATRFGRQSPIRLEAALIAEAAGQRDLAIGHLQIAVSDDTPNPAAYRRLARMRAQDGDYGAALALIDEGIERLSDADYFLPSRVFLAVRQEDAEALLTHLNACRNTNRPDLVVDCEANKTGVDPENLTEEQRQALERQGSVYSNVFGGVVGGVGNAADGVGGALGGLIN